jgi:hypothetical protein
MSVDSDAGPEQPEARIAQLVYRLANSWMTEGSEFEAGGEQEFSLLHNVQTGSGVQPASYPVGNGDPSLRVNRPGLEADHSSLTSTSTPSYNFMA